MQAEIYSSDVSGHRYALQIVTDVPHYGGALGSTLEEAQSWESVATDADRVTVHADATIALPILASALAATAGPRLGARTRPEFELSGMMRVDGMAAPSHRFEERG